MAGGGSLSPAKKEPKTPFHQNLCNPRQQGDCGGAGDLLGGADDLLGGADDLLGAADDLLGGALKLLAGAKGRLRAANRWPQGAADHNTNGSHWLSTALDQLTTALVTLGPSTRSG